MPTQTDEITLTLAILEQQTQAIANPMNHVAEIEDALNDLFAHGAAPDTLDAVTDNAASLLDIAEQVRRTCQTAMATARSLKASLDELKRGIRTCGTDIPEIDALRKMLEKEFYDSEWMSDLFYEDTIEYLAGHSPLDYGEATQLWDFLTGGELDGDSALWADLREWLERAERETRHWKRPV